jgi:hypothetical protein
LVGGTIIIEVATEQDATGRSTKTERRVLDIEGKPIAPGSPEADAAMTHMEASADALREAYAALTDEEKQELAKEARTQVADLERQGRHEDAALSRWGYRLLTGEDLPS